MALDRLRKKKDEMKKLKESIAKIQNKKHSDVSIQCNMEKEEKMKYHSRPKLAVTSMITIFDEVIHGTSQKKIPTTILNEGGKSGQTSGQGSIISVSAAKAIISSGAKAVV